MSWERNYGIQKWPSKPACGMCGGDQDTCKCGMAKPMRGRKSEAIPFVKGPRGERGKRGRPGRDSQVPGPPGNIGPSAYQIAVQCGFEGTEKEWLLSLKGDSAYECWIAEGYTGTKADFLEWLKGEDGSDGNDGSNGNDGSDGQSLSVGGDKSVLTDPVVGCDTNGNLIWTEDDRDDGTTTVEVSGNPDDFTCPVVVPNPAGGLMWGEDKTIEPPESIPLTPTELATVSGDKAQTATLDLTLANGSFRDITLRQLISVIDPFDVNNRFGLCGDGVTDNCDALKDLNAELDNTNYGKLIVKPGIYASSCKWQPPSPRDRCIMASVEGYGAVFKNTIVAWSNVCLSGFTVEDSPDAGFVFLRGQGASHRDLCSRNNEHGFYFGVASRQLVTLSNVTGLAVGGQVTINGMTGVIVSIDGSQVELAAINSNNIPVMFEIGQQTESGAIVEAVESCYGVNYQVSRTVFTNLVAFENRRKGFLFDESFTANRSWFTANQINTMTAINNGGKAMAVQSPNDATGSDGFGYNTILNPNFEGNGDLARQDGGVANVYLGGHMVSPSVGGVTSGPSFDIPSGRHNRFYGGRYVGIDETTFPAGIVDDVSVNSDMAGGTIDISRAVDEIRARNGTFEIQNGVPVSGV